MICAHEDGTTGERRGARDGRCQRGEGIPAALELVAGAVVLVAAARWLASPAGALAGVAPTVVALVVLLVGVGLVYLGFEGLLDARRRRRGEDDGRI